MLRSIAKSPHVVHCFLSGRDGFSQRAADGRRSRPKLLKTHLLRLSGYCGTRALILINLKKSELLTRFYRPASLKLAHKSFVFKYERSKYFSFKYGGQNRGGGWVLHPGVAAYSVYRPTSSTRAATLRFKAIVSTTSAFASRRRIDSCVRCISPSATAATTLRAAASMV
jgi:hypothetical protein